MEKIQVICSLKNAITRNTEGVYYAERYRQSYKEGSKAPKMVITRVNIRRQCFINVLKIHITTVKSHYPMYISKQIICHRRKEGLVDEMEP